MGRASSRTFIPVFDQACAARQVEATVALQASAADAIAGLGRQGPMCR
jgi:hypothetical protein